MTMSIGAFSGLHSAWQDSVTSLDTKGCGISEEDISLIKKYRSLQSLRLTTPKPSSSHLAPWEVVGLLDPALSNLCSISVQGADVYKFLTVLEATRGLATRLQRLTIEDSRHTMSN
jgi:hypothetical protein